MLQPRKGKQLVPIKGTDGYLEIKICNKSVGIHRLVAQAFLNLPNSSSNTKYEVNHIDCNRANNNVNNLEYMTHKENVDYSIKLKHHFCTRNLFKENNPNYNNHKLSYIYKTNPELAIEKLSRPKSQNGRSIKINIYDKDKIYISSFDWIGGCAEYLRNNNFTTATVKSIRTNITHAIKCNKKYLNHYYTKA